MAGMKIVLGVGNPGPEYERTRHNIGFMVVDTLAERLGGLVFRSRFESLVAEWRAGRDRAALVKPQTFVNESGRALRRAAEWFEAAPDDVLVVLDDYNLPLGAIRARRGGSPGGHRGLESVIRHLGTPDVPRLRVGIGRDPSRRDRDFVLSPFASEERELAAAAVRRAADAVETWLREGIERCMNVYNARPDAPAAQEQEEENV